MYSIHGRRAAVDASVADHTLTVRISAATHKGYIRRANEDTILVGDWIGYGESASRTFEWGVDHRGLLLAVADGLGGHRAGEVASRFVVEELSQRAEPGSLVLEESLTKTLRGIDTDLRNMALGTPSLHGMGSTLAAAYISASGLTIANVGDSRAYVFDSRDGLRQVSLDHVPQSASYERQLAGRRRTTHAITQAFGGSVSKTRPLRPHIVQLPASLPGSSLLLCSDGLSDLVDEVALIASLASERTGADALVRQALEAGGIDNISAIIVRFGS